MTTATEAMLAAALTASATHMAGVHVPGGTPEPYASHPSEAQATTQLPRYPTSRAFSDSLTDPHSTPAAGSTADA